VTTELFCGGRIYSPSAPDATAMAVTDGIISWIGEDRTGRALHPGVPVIDLAGSFVAPAFVDTHVHVTDLGLSLIGLDLSRSTSVEDCVRMVREHAASSEDDLIWGHGWDESTWSEQRPPTTAELDAAAPGRAVYLTRVDSHSAAVSTHLRFAASAADATSGYCEQTPTIVLGRPLARCSPPTLDAAPELLRSMQPRGTESSRFTNVRDRWCRASTTSANS
jgi:predicted amidohydrolase YtcJ